MLPSDMVSGITSSLESMKVDPGKIATVHATLTRLTDMVAGSRFMDLQVPADSFGGSPESALLAKHHGVAKQVVEDTLVGLQADLAEFAAATLKAAALITDADVGSAELMQARQDAVEVLRDATSHSEADVRNLESRAEHVTTGSVEG